MEGPQDNSDSLPAAVGEIIDGYRLDGVLGKGGMGCVYQATHTKLGRKVALKMLASKLAGESEFVSRFLSEAKIVNDAKHPNIVDIFDFIELDEPRRVACVMELLPGASLTSVLKTRALTARQAINCVLQMISALQAVHALGIVHRDLKPDNIFIIAPIDTDLSFSPSVKILDFGIAKTSDKSDSSSSHKTQAGVMIGTPSYMAPEQIAAEPVSPATDIYALGEIFHEMITGERLFKGEPVAILKRKLTGEIPLFSLDREMPAHESVESLIRDSIALLPKSRPTLAEFEARLVDIMEQQPVHTVDLNPHPAVVRRPSSAHTPLTLNSMAGVRSPVLRRKTVPALIAVAAAAALGFGWVFVHRPIEVISEGLPPEAQAAAPVVEKHEPPSPPVEKHKTVRLSSTPQGAEVADADSGEALGKAPVTIPFAPDRPSRKVIFKLNGYAPLTVDVLADAEAMTVALAPAPAQQKPEHDEKRRPAEESASPIKKKQLKSW